MSKLINISDELYGKLKKIKGSDSYTVVIDGLLSKRSNKEKILEFAGKGGIDEGEVKEMKKEWRRWSERYA
jgi:predicted CopG family antitoxin